jgi:hypothetical protein
MLASFAISSCFYGTTSNIKGVDLAVLAQLHVRVIDRPGRREAAGRVRHFSNSLLPFLLPNYVERHDTKQDNAGCRPYGLPRKH